MDIGLLIFGIIVVVNIVRFFKKAAEGYNSTPERKRQLTVAAETPSFREERHSAQDDDDEGETYEWASIASRPETPPKAPVIASVIASEPPQHPHPLLGSKRDVARVLVLGEVLGEPRSKRPWGPRSTRK